jgi:lipoprotein NlpD
MLSMRFILILFVLMLTACGGGSQAVAPVGAYKSKSQQGAPPAVYKVRRGDTLFSVSWRFGMDFKHVASINGIRSPYTIYIGQKLRFKPDGKVASKTKKTSKTARAKTKKKATKTTSRQSSTVPANQRLSWRWPIKGKVISTYSKSAAGRKGIDIAGKSGQKVAAAASGKVVYSGNGLPRYGNLIIIKHNDAYLSAYAHNKNLLVKEGQQVKVGQKIALLGRTGTQRDQLHFEIRRHGKPVDPMRFLPKR